MSFGQKLKNEGFEKYIIQFGDPKKDFWAYIQDQNDFLKYSGPILSNSGWISI